MSWRTGGWASGATIAATVAAVLTLGATRWLQLRYDRAFAFRMAATTAGYIAAVTPAPIPPPPPPAPRARRGTAPRALPRTPAPPPPPARPPRGYDLPQLLTQARALRTLPGFTSDVEVYYGTAPLVDATAPALSPDDLRELEGGGAGQGHWRARAALVPLQDRDGREVVGAVAVRPRPLPRGPLPGGIGFAVPAAILAVAAAAAIAFRRRPLRRGGYAAAALLLAVAGYADVRAAARQSTDRWLLDTRRLLQEAATRLPPPRARVALDDLVSLVRDAELVPGDPGETAPRRVRIEGQRRAVAAVLIGPGRWVELRTVPAEDASIGWAAVLLACAFIGAVAIWTLRWAERTPRRQRRETMIAWGFLAPATLHLAVFTIVPLFLALYLALHSHKAFAGLTNFRGVLHDPLTWTALRNTALYALYVPASAALALAIALALHGRGGRWVPRLVWGAFLVPFISSVVAIALVWQLIYQSGSLGLGRTDWLGRPGSALLALMLVSIWAHVGGQLVVFLAGLQAIPRSYLDAARVDGAGAWRRFWRITFPLLRPVTLFVLVTGIVNAFQLFTTVNVLTQGGPAPSHATETVVTQIYARYGAGDLGSASALALLLFGILLAITIPQLRLLRSRVEHA